MLPLVFDDSVGNKKKKNDDNDDKNANDNAELVDEDGFNVKKDHNIEGEMPLKDIVVLTIFSNWFNVELKDSHTD